jgi:hypothetical protein
MFLWVDLRAAFAGQAGSWADEEALWSCMAQQHKVVLTPGACVEELLLLCATYAVVGTGSFWRQVEQQISFTCLACSAVALGHAIG